MMWYFNVYQNTQIVVSNLHQRNMAITEACWPSYLSSSLPMWISCWSVYSIHIRVTFYCVCVARVCVFMASISCGYTLMSLWLLAIVNNRGHWKKKKRLECSATVCQSYSSLLSVVGHLWCNVFGVKISGSFHTHDLLSQTTSLRWQSADAKSARTNTQHTLIYSRRCCNPERAVRQPDVNLKQTLSNSTTTTLSHCLKQGFISYRLQCYVSFM